MDNNRFAPAQERYAALTQDAPEMLYASPPCALLHPDTRVAPGDLMLWAGDGARPIRPQGKSWLTSHVWREHLAELRRRRDAGQAAIRAAIFTAYPRPS